MKCPVCGNESDGKFCENCGTPLTQNNTQENTENTNGFDSFGQNPTPEQPSYDYNTENQTYGQPYQSNQNYGQGYNDGYSNPNQNGTSYGQQFTNSQNNYSGQQFTNVPNGGNNKGNKTAVIITSVVAGIIVLLIVIISVVACNIIPNIVDTVDKHIDKAIDDASSHISKGFNKETTIPTDSITSDIDDDAFDDDDDGDGELTDNKSHVTYSASYDYEGWKITGVDDDYFYNNLSLSSKKLTEITINIPEQIDGVDVVEISSFGVYLPNVKVKVVIPKTVKVVDSFAFSFNDNIYELEIADGVKVLKSDAFTSMSNLKSVTVPDSVKEMEECGLGIGVDDDYENVPIKGFKMYCKKGSAAETYAKENNLSYEIIK